MEAYIRNDNIHIEYNSEATLNICFSSGLQPQT
jgi:hypothetical protein